MPRADTVGLLQLPSCWCDELDRVGTRGPWLHDWTGQDLVQHGRDHVHMGFAAAQERELVV